MLPDARATQRHMAAGIIGRFRGHRGTPVAYGEADNEGTSRRQRLHSRNGWGGPLRIAATAKTVN